MAANFLELVRLQRTDEPNTFLSCSNPEKMGNPADIAYGGCVMALSVMAAFETVQSRPKFPDFEIYSLLGNYLGPTLSDRKVKLKVTSIRDTRSFATRFVLATQTYDDGSERSTFSATVDFIAPNAIDVASFGGPYTRYSKKPKQTYPGPQGLPSMKEIIDDKVQKGRVPRQAADLAGKVMFALSAKTVDQVQPPESLHAQTAMGFDSSFTSPQHSKPLTDRIAVDWFKCQSTLGQSSPAPSSNPKALPISPASANAAFAAFALDAALSFIPLTFSKKSLTEAGSVSSLDCALRFHTKVNLDEYHLREMQTIQGNDCRTYSEAMLWDQNHNLVATMNQACILRPKISKPSSKAKL